MQQSFQKLYNDPRPPIRRSCGEYVRFNKLHGFTKMVISAADDKVEKIQEIHKLYLTDFLTYLSYEVDHSYAEKAQMDWEDQQRKLHKR